MGIQINGTNGLDLISAADGSLTIEGANFRDLQQLSVVGIATFQSDVSIAGTLTYEDVTNVESIGVATFRDNVHVGAGLSVVGVSTIRNDLNLTIGSGVLSNDDEVGALNYIYPSNSNINAKIVALQNGGSSGADLAFFTRLQGDSTNTDGGLERLRITSTGDFVVAAGATFGSSAGVVTYFGDGSQLSGISVGLTTEATTPSNAVTELDLTAAQDHKVTATGICTITVTGGTEADSHTIRIVNSGIATVGFSTYFLFPSGSAPTLPTASGAISLISFTVHRVGAAGTQLLAGASVNFS